MSDVGRAWKRAAGALLFGLGAIGFSAAHAVIPAAVNAGKRWEVFKDHWAPEDEAGYAEFVQAIGRSDCTSLPSCLADPANPYRSADDPVLRGDCADMAYILRAYYAWKNGLPFSFQNAMRTADGARQDIRYSSAGNVVAGRRSVRNFVSDPGAFLKSIPPEVSTAMFRTDPVKGGGRSHDDFYPIEISREAVTPGVIAYDIYGHVGIVYDILDDGRVMLISSHPDESVTRTTYGPNFMRAKPALGGGLKAWRPIYVEGAEQQQDGSLIGGRMRAVANKDLPHFSVEQFYGNVPSPSGVWHYGEFHFQNRTLKYYDYVRRKLAVPGFKYDPVEELRFGLETICGAVKARKIAVEDAVIAGVYLRPHPKKLPPNIYGAYGDWEEYSTPSRDARLKVSFIELRRQIEQLVDEVNAGAEGVRYHGDNLPDDLLKAFQQEKDACTFTYWRSDKTRMRLNLAHVMNRLWDLSFDPYNCPERRWGARGAELETCTDDAEKEQWYNALKFLRFQAERTYDLRMDFALDELKAPMLAPPEEGGLGVDAPADADILAYLTSLQPVVTASSDGAGEVIPVDYDDAADDDDDGVYIPAWHAWLQTRHAH